MDPGIYSFTVGNFKCLAVSDGTLTYGPPVFPPPSLFLCTNAPQDRLADDLCTLNSNLEQWKEWTSDYTCLFVDTGSYKVLIDAGAGGLGPGTGKLLTNLRSAGITPEDIDLVILTHAHPDHIGGNTDAEGKPVFNKAGWVIRRDEWQFWISEQAERTLAEHGRDILIGTARKNLLPLAGSIRLIDSGAEIIPGIKAIEAAGHTPGQMALSISSQGESLLYLSDIIIHPLHLMEPEWYSMVDILPQKVASTRLHILRQASIDRTLVMAFHFPFPGLGFIVPGEKAWKWTTL